MRDDRGKYVAGRAEARYVGRDRFVGIRHDGWLLEGGVPATVSSLVVDEFGEPAAGVPVTTIIEYRKTTASRVKGAGNAYLTRYEHSWVEVARCEEPSGDEPVTCSFTPEKPGYYKLSSSIVDGRGRPHRSEIWRWGIGEGRVMWEAPPGHQLDVEPEKSGYRVGETARFLIRNPFPGAEAMFTVERIGVQKSWTKVLEGATEVVEVEVGPDHVPGFYFSVIVTSPRVEQPPGAAGDVDLGKPAFRMGYVRVPVRDPYKEIDGLGVDRGAGLPAASDGDRGSGGPPPSLGTKTLCPRWSSRWRFWTRRSSTCSRMATLLRSIRGVLHARAARRPQLQPPDPPDRHPEVRKEGRESAGGGGAGAA